MKWQAMIMGRRKQKETYSNIISSSLFFDNLASIRIGQLLQLANWSADVAEEDCKVRLQVVLHDTVTLLQNYTISRDASIVTQHFKIYYIWGFFKEV